MIMITMLKRARWGQSLIPNSIILPTLAVLLSSGLALTSVAQPVQTISYQGLLKSNSVAMNGAVNLDVTYYYAGSGAVLVTESFTGVPVTNGVFGIELGSVMGGIPASIDLTQAIELGISVNGSPELVPRTRLTAVPYALSTHSIDGLLASATPENGKIFPMPLDASGHISPTLLPAPLTLNGMPAVNGNLEIAGGPNISVERNLATGQVVISGAASQITGITLGRGLIGGGITGLISVALDSGGILGSWIKPGTITSRQMTTGFAGNALYFGEAGNLNLAFDPGHFVLNANELQLRTDVPVDGTVGAFNALNIFGASMLGIGEGATTIIASPLSMLQGGDANEQRITSLGAPVDPTDAATKQYVDETANGLGTAMTNKLDAQLAPGNIFVGNAGGIAQGMTLGGDAVLDNGVPTFNGFSDEFVLDNNSARMTITALQGIPLESSEPSDGQFLGYNQSANSWQPMTVTVPTPPITGMVTLTHTDGSNSAALTTVVSNSAVTASSIIMLTVVANGTNSTPVDYSVWVSGLSTGSFTINLGRTTLRGWSTNEGATVNYVIFNYAVPD